MGVLISILCLVQVMRTVLWSSASVSGNPFVPFMNKIVDDKVGVERLVEYSAFCERCG